MQAGQDPEAFARVTIREMAVIAQASARRDAQQAWLAAQYARFAYHQPNEMPDDPGERRPAEPRHTQADVVYVKAWMRAMAGGTDGS